MTDLPVSAIIMAVLSALILGGALTFIVLDAFGLIHWATREQVDIERVNRHADGTVEKGRML